MSKMPVRMLPYGRGSELCMLELEYTAQLSSVLCEDASVDLLPAPSNVSRAFHFFTIPSMASIR